ncbi:MAG: hypothetical protein OEW12_06460 [Deltaproteobacteria bacterium]|nr:hypothetical protein [Deltaproteobacteria bacterium]
MNKHLNFSTPAVKWMVVFLVLSLFAQPVLAGKAAKEKTGHPPQILTSDLVQRQVVARQKKTVVFTIADSDKIVDVTINGEKKSFISSETVVLTHTFAFTKGRNMIEVVARDAAGNSRTKNFFVEYYPDGMPKRK